MKPIRVALIGTGCISYLHERGYREWEDARITQRVGANFYFWSRELN